MGGDVATCASVAALAERRGLCSAWTAEFYDRSATVSLAAMAAATSRIALGSAIMYAFGRTPLVTVAEARDLDEVSGGRFVLGLGTGTRQQVAAWHGLERGWLSTGGCARAPRSCAGTASRRRRRRSVRRSAAATCRA